MSQQVGDMERTRTFAWGGNSSAQLGDGTTDNRHTPVPVVGLTNVRAVAAGATYSLALLSDGMVRVWGNNFFDQVGDLINVRAVAAGTHHSLALLSDGTVRAWGNNAFGQLGDGTTDFRSTPVTVVGLTNVRAVAAGLVHNLATVGALQIEVQTVLA